MTCPNCTGSHYIMDNPALGDCTCVTAQALRMTENRLVQLAGLILAAKESMYGGRDARPRTGAPVALAFEMAERLLRG